MAKNMTASTRARRDTRVLEGLLNNRPDGGAGQGLKRRPTLEKHLAVVPLRPIVSQVGDQRLPDLLRQG